MGLAVDRVTKFTCVELHPHANVTAGAAFLRGVLAAYPSALHTALTDNGAAFTNRAAMLERVATWREVA